MKFILVGGKYLYVRERWIASRETDKSVSLGHTSGQSIRIECGYSQYSREALIMVVGALITPSKIKGLETPAS